MATYQNTYDEAPGIGLPGQVVNEELSNRISREVETPAGIAFGQPAERGSDDHGVALLNTGTFIGFAILAVAVPASSTNPDKYPHRFTGAFLTKGIIYATAGGTVAAGDAVYWNAASGRYVNTASGNVQIPGAVFDSSGADGGIVRIALNLR